MAERRMFTGKITESDSFLDMPLSSQCLYFHLCMYADDEGFVKNPKRIQRMIGAADDDMKVIISKNFVLTYKSGVIVIKHWKMHNAIRKDRMHETEYKEEKAMLYIKENGAYTLDAAQGKPLLTTKCQPNDNQMTTKCHTEVRLGKDRLGKDRLERENAREEKRSYGIHNNVYLTDGELAELTKAYPNDYQDMIENLSTYMRSKGKVYEDHYATMMKWKHQDEQKAKKETYDYRKDIV